MKRVALGRVPTFELFCAEEFMKLAIFAPILFADLDCYLFVVFTIESRYSLCIFYFILFIFFETVCLQASKFRELYKIENFI